MWRAFAFSLTVVALSPTAALAQQKFELSPFAGVRASGSLRGDIQLVTFNVLSAPSFGTFVNYDLIQNLQLEFLWGHQGSTLVSREANIDDPDNPTQSDLLDISVDYFHGGILYGAGNETYEPYVAFGLGATKFGPEERDDFTIETGLTKFSFSIGGGLKGYVSDRIGFRFEARAFGTRVGERQEDLACSPLGCVKFERTSTFWQSHFIGSVMIRF